ncbi:MAG: type II toxin-antitoxin system VapC family toxin [Planctomycetes bacterium]|nr:type II toxin-antitoxin system VapC family toxin [Planctomycetota bacterium]
MSLFVLDTDILSLLQLSNRVVANRVLRHPPQDLAVAIISVEEQLRSWFTLCRSAKTRSELAYAYERFTRNVSSLKDMQVLSFTEQAIGRFEALRRMKLGVKANDLRIAAIAIENSAIVVTRNRKDFGRIPGLLIEDWSI